MTYLTKRKAYFLIFLCFVIYTAAYVGRLNYGAALVEIISVFRADKATGGLVSSFFFFAYGAGQLLNGILCKRYNPRIMLTVSLLCSAALNFFMPFAGSLSAMKWLWMGNGIVQSVLWSTVIQTLSRYIPDAMLSKAIFAMSATYTVGTFGAYGFAAVGIAIGHWQFVFFVAAGLLTFAGVLWLFGFGYLAKQTKAAAQEHVEREETATAVAPVKQKLSVTRYSVLFAVGIVLSAVATGFIRDGTVTWTPSVLYEVFTLNKSFSVVVTFSLPLLSVFGTLLADLLHKKIKNFSFIIVLTYTCAIGLLVLLISVCLPFKMLVLTIVLFTALSCCMAAAANILTSRVPLYFRNKMSSGALAGIIDTCCYVGSTLSTVLLGYLADTYGWTAVFAAMIVLASVALLICAVAAFFCREKRGCIKEKEEKEPNVDGREV